MCGLFVLCSCASSGMDGREIEEEIRVCFVGVKIMFRLVRSCSCLRVSRGLLVDYGGHVANYMRVEVFMEKFYSKLREITAEEFRGNVNALIEVKMEKHKNLKEESMFYW
ncbi:hypothetical protein Droror1_Dr00020248 [Drosera rotundifolia]